MKFLAAALLLLTALVSCAGPAPEPVGEAAVVQPGVECRVGREGGPAVADRGIGGTGLPAKAQVADRGIGGTGIVGIVTGFASICVDGLEVRFDRTAAVSLNGVPATTAQLRVGQLVAITASGLVEQARTIAIRYEVSGPIEAIDTGSGAMTVAGQRVIVLPTTWVTGHFGLGNWATVSGLRQPDGVIVASRLDRARVGSLAVRGQLVREHGTTRIGSLILLGPAVATAETGSFVSVAARYVDMSAQVTNITADPLQADPVSYFGAVADRLVVQAMVRVEHRTVWLSSGQKFTAGPQVEGKGSGYHNAIVWLNRTSDGSFVASDLRYTGYRAKPVERAVRTIGTHGLVLPPEAPPGPPVDPQPVGNSEGETVIDSPGDPAPTPSPIGIPTSNAPPAGNDQSASTDRAHSSAVSDVRIASLRGRR